MLLMHCRASATRLAAQRSWSKTQSLSSCIASSLMTCDPKPWRLSTVSLSTPSTSSTSSRSLSSPPLSASISAVNTPSDSSCTHAHKACGACTHARWHTERWTGTSHTRGTETSYATYYTRVREKESVPRTRARRTQTEKREPARKQKKHSPASEQASERLR
jgi:hypothetical protein